MLLTLLQNKRIIQLKLSGSSEMLDLIVLGIVPGTSFVITLWWALVFALVAAIAVFIYIEASKKSVSSFGTLESTDAEAELSELTI